jgi:hypothetical protein
MKTNPKPKKSTTKIGDEPTGRSLKSAQTSYYRGPKGGELFTAKAKGPGTGEGRQAAKFLNEDYGTEKNPKFNRDIMMDPNKKVVAAYIKESNKQGALRTKEALTNNKGVIGLEARKKAAAEKAAKQAKGKAMFEQGPKSRSLKAAMATKKK